jgi:formylglycine-generating enzyme required for sulfatase activity
MDPIVRETLQQQHGLQIEERIGLGGFSEVYRARSAGGLVCAIKVSLDRIGHLDGKLQQELQALEAVKGLTGHPHLVTLMDWWLMHGYLVTRWELATDGNLLDLAHQRGGKLAGKVLCPYMVEAAGAIDFLNGQGLYHRDVKPANLLLFHGHVKLADLGLVKVAGASSATHTGSGTLGYKPPEAYREHRLCATADLYGLAATYVRLRTGREPFGDSLPEVVDRQREGTVDVRGLLASEAEVVRSALAAQPEQRPQDGAVAWVKRLYRALQPPSEVRDSVRAARAQQEAPPVQVRPASLAPRFTNSLGMEFVLIPAGEYMMGSPEEDTEAFRDEMPQHRVRIARPFYLGVYPVTQQQYQAVMGANPSHFKGNVRRPVDSVTWPEAVEFCRRLSEREGHEYRLPAARRRSPIPPYRLPTEAEWEYACRAGSTTRWFFGDDVSLLGEYAWYRANSRNTTHPVGGKKPNAWGLYDMLGNVWEWCQDVWHDDYQGAPQDGSAWLAGDGSVRVLRGGSWNFDARSARSAERNRPDPRLRYVSDGFRAAMSA